MGSSAPVVRRADGGDRRVPGAVDDAAGEAFDKTAKILGLPYPGGPALARLAEAGDPGRFRFPRPMTDRPGLDFSFSGLKTFALNTLRGEVLNGLVQYSQNGSLLYTSNGTPVYPLLVDTALYSTGATLVDVVIRGVQ